MKERRRACRAALLGAALVMVAPRVRAEQVLRETIGRGTVTVDRDADGMLAMSVAGGGAAVRIGQGTVRSERVPLARGEALVLRVTGEREGLGVLTAVAGGAPSVRFAGEIRGEGAAGLGRTTDVRTTDVDGDGARDVVLFERHDALRACALGRLASNARRVDPNTLELAPYAIDPLANAWVEHALTSQPRALSAVALAPNTPRPAAPVLPRARLVRGVVDEAPTGIADGSAATAWEAAARDVAVLSVPLAGLPMERLVLTAPAAPNGLPRAFSLVTDAEVRVDVGVSDAVLAATPAGGRIAVSFVPPSPTRCLALVVTQPSSRAGTAVADVAVASPLDRDPDALAALVRSLDGPDGDAAGELLLLLGTRGIDALAGGLSSLADRGAHRAVRLLATQRSPRAAAALAEALTRAAVANEARAALLRFGPAAVTAVAGVAPSHPRAIELLVAMRAPLVDRVRGAAAVLAAEASGWRLVRGSVRVLLAQAAHEGAPFDAWLAALPADAGSASRGLSVAVEAAATDAQRAAVAARARAISSSEFADRYRLLVPLAGDTEGRARVLTVAQSDDDDDLRAEAARALGVVPGAREGLARVLEDRVPRVRVEAVRALAHEDSARPALRERLRDDRWPSVRAASAEVLVGDEGSVPALFAALDDVSVPVVRAAMASLAPVRVATVGPRLMGFAEDLRRNPELRGEALSVLADRCEPNVAERIAHVIDTQSDPILPPSEQAVAHAGLAALARIDFARARALLQRMDANAQAVAAITRAARRSCQRPASGTSP